MTISELRTYGFSFGDLAGSLTLRSGSYYENSVSIWYGHKSRCPIKDKEEVDTDCFSISITKNSAGSGTSAPILINSVADIERLKSFF